MTTVATVEVVEETAFCADGPLTVALIRSGLTKPLTLVISQNGVEFAVPLSRPMGTCISAALRVQLEALAAPAAHEEVA